LNVSWSPLDYESISYIISAAANTNKITIYVSPYTYNLLGPSDFELAASKNITIALITTNYVEDRRLRAITTKGDGSTVLSNDGTYKTLPTKTSQLENDSNFLTEHQSLENYVTKEEMLGSIPTEYTSIILKSSTEGSTKKFRLTIDDEGVITTEQITEF
jgi:hypothetical protein